MSKYKGFTSVQLQKPTRSDFDMSHYKRLTTRMGRLTPVVCMECVPSDSVDVSSEILLRMAPILAPIYDEIIMYVHYFFVPNRLLWEDWEEFITGGRLGPGVNPEPIPPYYDIGLCGDMNWTGLFGKSSLADYLGVPDLTKFQPDATGYEGIHLDAMPHLAYQLIWFNYYRDRNFTGDDVNGMDTFPVPSGAIDPMSNLVSSLALQTRAYEQDYFTSALPWTQRGAEVLMPLAGTGSVTYLDEAKWVNPTGTFPASSATSHIYGETTSAGPGEAWVRLSNSSGGATAQNLGIKNIDEIVLESSNVSINDFRSAYALQVWLERNAVGGSRYNESTLAHFAVRPQDQRLQRPEYIGGGRIAVKISEVVSTAVAYTPDGSQVTPQANMAGHGVTYGNTNRARYFCTEHGFIMGICSIMNPPSYHQGLPKMFRRRSFLDYPWPTFAKLGEQQIDKAELYANPANLTEDVNGQLPLFGYTSRYADWKWLPNSNHGDFHDTLLFWTLTREFGSNPTLGQNFINFDPATQDRIFAVNGSGDNFWLLAHNKINVRRPLPYFGTPNTLGFS